MLEKGTPYTLLSVERKKVYSALDLARQLNCSLAYILNCIKENRLKAFKDNYKTRRVWRIHAEDFEVFYKENNLSTSNKVGRKNKTRKKKSYINKGYRYVYAPFNNRADIHGYVPEHVIVAEQTLRRPLTKKEQVHHINGIKDDNRPENLKVYKDAREHLLKGHGNDYKVASELRKYLVDKENYYKMSYKKKALILDSLLKILEGNI